MGAADRLDAAWRDEAARIDQEMTTLTQDLTDTRALVEDLQDRLGEEQQTTDDLTRRLAASDAAVTDLDTRLRASTALVEQHAATIAQQTVTIDQQQARIVELEAQPAESSTFIPGETVPTSTALGDAATNVGRLTVNQPREVYNGPYPIVGSDDPIRPKSFVGVDFPRIAVIASGYVDFDLCQLRGTDATGDTGLINTRAAAVKGVRVRRSEFDPGEAGAHWWINGVIGHHLTVEESVFRRVVDAANFLNDHGDDLACVFRGNVVEWLAHFYNPTKGIVHPSDYETHNDLVHIQGGKGVVVDGNRMSGRVFQPDGVTLPATPERQGKPWHGLAGNFVMVQQNVRPDATINPVITRNVFDGCRNGIVARTRDYNKGTGTPYTVEAWGNICLDLAHEWWSTTGRDAHNVVGGKWYGLRFDSLIKLIDTPAGSPWQPRTDHVEWLSNAIRYHDGPPIDSVRRGKQVPGRSDNFPGGRKPPA